MTQSTNRRRIVGGSIIGTLAVAGAAFGIAPAAHAGATIPNVGSIMVVTKTDAATGAPLSGALLNVCATSVPGEGTRQAGFADQIAAIDAAITHLRETDDVDALQADVDRLTTARDTAQTALDTANASPDLAIDAAAAQAVLDAYAPIAAEQAALRDASAAATATWQATVAEIRALQDAGDPVPADLAVREAEEQDAAEAAAQAAADYAAAHVAESDAAIAAQGELDRLAAAQTAVTDAQTALTAASNELTHAQSALANAYGEPDERKIAALTAMRDAIAAQMTIDGDVQPTPDDSGRLCYLVTTQESGRVSVPVAYATSGTVTVTEVEAPDGYEQVDGTITATPTSGLDGSTSTVAWTTDNDHLSGASDRNELSYVQSGGAVHRLTLTNDTIPEVPTEPEVPVTPPTTPPTTPPVTQPTTPPTTPPAPTPVVPEAPRTLAYTGTDDTVGWLAGTLALVLGAAGTGVWALRRRRDA